MWFTLHSVTKCLGLVVKPSDASAITPSNVQKTTCSAENRNRVCRKQD